MRILITNCGDLKDIIPEKWYEGMSAEKRARLSKFKFEKDRVLAVTAHRLLCWGLVNGYGIMPSENGWCEGEFGKPYIKGHEDVFFSISHSGQMAMCAIGGRETGADIQVIKPVGDNVTAFALSAEEKRAYADSGNDTDLFYKIWVLKEAYLKFKGTGIKGLKNITVYPDGGRIVTNVTGCGFSLIEGIAGYKAAVCSEGLTETETEYIKADMLNSF